MWGGKKEGQSVFNLKPCTIPWACTLLGHHPFPKWQGFFIQSILVCLNSKVWRRIPDFCMYCAVTLFIPFLRATGPLPCTDAEVKHQNPVRHYDIFQGQGHSQLGFSSQKPPNPITFWSSNWDYMDFMAICLFDPLPPEWRGGIEPTGPLLSEASAL